MSPSRGQARDDSRACMHYWCESPRRRQLQLSIRGRTVASAACLSGGDRPRRFVELTSAIATYNMVVRFLVALAITPEK